MWWRIATPDTAVEMDADRLDAADYASADVVFLQAPAVATCGPARRAPYLAAMRASRDRALPIPPPLRDARRAREDELLSPLLLGQDDPPDSLLYETGPDRSSPGEPEAHAAAARETPVLVGEAPATDVDALRSLFARCGIEIFHCSETRGYTRAQRPRGVGSRWMRRIAAGMCWGGALGDYDDGDDTDGGGGGAMRIHLRYGDVGNVRQQDVTYDAGSRTATVLFRGHDAPDLQLSCLLSHDSTVSFPDKTRRVRLVCARR